jgi:superfamily II DNA/RNA helicase
LLHLSMTWRLDICLIGAVMRLNFTGNVLHQVVEVLDPSVRDRRLDELLRQYHASRRNRILVFVLYKKEASRVEAMLAKRGWKVRACQP